MKKFICVSLLSVAFLGLAACGSDDDPADSTTTGGETTGGETTGGETTGGETTGGETTGGETTGGETTGGETTGGETTGSGTLTGTVQRWGIVDVEDDEGELDLFATFGEFTSNISAAQFNTELLPPLDTCEVETFNIGEIPDLDDDDLIFDSDFNSLSAGETVIVSSPGGTFATLLKFTFAGVTGYQLDDSSAALLAPAPSGLTVDIPGDEFPAYSNVSIPDVAALNVTAPVDGSTITPTTVFTWTPGADPKALVDLYVSSFSNGVALDVNCVLEDDGSFTFPANVQTQMGTGFTSSFFDFYRTNYTLLQNGTTVLITSNTVGR